MHVLKLSRDFAISLTIGRALQLKELGLLDVLSLPSQPSQFTAIVSDPILFSRVLWELVDQSGLTYEAFAEIISANDSDELYQAFTAELVSFFPIPTRRVVSLLAASARDSIESRDNAKVAMIQEMLSEVGTLSGSLEESLESIQDRSVIVSSTTWPSVVSLPSGVEQVT